MSYKFKVFCRCATFNHAAYIQDALDGFCMQKTSFPYVCLIMDDASTDGEQDVIRCYIENNFLVGDDAVAIKKETDDYKLVFAQHQTNKNCFFIALYLKYNHYSIRKDRTSYFEEWSDASEYIAMCEGDDYWINPHKLALQVEYLDNHPECSAVFGDMVFRNEKIDPPTEQLIQQPQSIYSVKDVYRGKVFPINSICMRNAVWKHYGDLAAIKSNGDMKIAYLAVKYGDVYKFDELFSVYRKTGKGLSSQWDARNQFIHDINEWYVFFEQLGFPDQTSHALFQTKLINDYIYGNGLRNFPYHEIKHSIFVSKWYIYLFSSITYPFKRLYRLISHRLNKQNGKR